jgi:hypothetical protein
MMNQRKRVKLGPKTKGVSGDLFGGLFPDLPAASRDTILQLQARDNEINQWFAEDPTRVAAMQTNPKETLAQLSASLGIKLTPASALNLPTFTVLKNPLICECHSRNSLITSVWNYIGQNTQNLAAWSANPIQVIDQVAASTNASSQELKALVNAFDQVLEIGGVVLDPLGAVRNLQGVGPSGPIIR